MEFVTEPIKLHVAADLHAQFVEKGNIQGILALNVNPKRQPALLCLFCFVYANLSGHVQAHFKK